MNIKSIVKTCMAWLPCANVLFFKYIYRRTMSGSNQTLISRLLNVAHSIDHLTSRGLKPHRQSILVFEILIAEFNKRSIHITDEIAWALQMYSIAKNGLSNSYYNSLKITPNENRNQLEATNLIQIIQNRRSVRKWNNNPIDIEKVKSVIDIAKWAPSSCNKQTWRVMYIDKPEDKSFLADYYSGHNKFWEQAPALLLIFIDKDAYSEDQFHYAYLDAGAFIQNILLLLHAESFGGCWIGFHSWNIFNNSNSCQEKKFYEHFNLCSTLLPVSILAIGHSAIKPKNPYRKNIDDIILTH